MIIPGTGRSAPPCSGETAAMVNAAGTTGIPKPKMNSGSPALNTTHGKSVKSGASTDPMTGTSTRRTTTETGSMTGRLLNNVSLATRFRAARLSNFLNK